MAQVSALHPIVLNFYANTIRVIIFGFICLVQIGSATFLPNDEEIQRNGAWVFWVLQVPLNGICSYLAFQLKIRAYKYDKVARVSTLFYFESIIALCIDLLIFQLDFTLVQACGICLIVAMFIFIILLAYCGKHTDQHDKEQVNLQEETKVLDT